MLLNNLRCGENDIAVEKFKIPLQIKKKKKLYGK